jgi:hypothetical protein
VLAGVTTISEVIRVAGAPEDLPEYARRAADERPAAAAAGA